MKVTTVSLNPAIDQTVLCSPFALDTVNRGQVLRQEAGGKGVNVATFLADSGCPAAATGFLGRENAAIFETWLAQRGIEDCFVRIAGATRLGIKIVDLVSGHTTDINLPGLSPDEAAVTRLLELVPVLASASDWLVLTGSLPPGLPVDFYARLTRLAHAQGCPVLLDSSGPALRAGLAAGPDILKPNLAELQELLSCTFDPADLQGIAGAARGLLGTGATISDDAAMAYGGAIGNGAGIRLVVVSLGPQGALFVEPGRTLHALPPALEVRSTVGAGDALVAGLLSALLAGLDLPACACRAIAFSAAAVSAERRALPAMRELEALASLVSLDKG